MPKRSLCLLLALVALLMSPLSVFATGCEVCKYSPGPGHFGFCRPAASGYATCSEYVADSMSGRTDCTLPANTNCTTEGDGGPGGGGFGGGGTGGGSGDCWWTDLNGGCILSF